MMEEIENLEVIMQLIMHSGDAKGNAVMAIQESKAGNFKKANETIEKADKSLVLAHRAQTGLLTQESSGESVQISLLMVHGQDHLMTGIAFVDLAKEIIELHKLYSEIGKNQNA